jgi:hypothetical protein
LLAVAALVEILVVVVVSVAAVVLVVLELQVDSSPLRVRLTQSPLALAHPEQTVLREAQMVLIRFFHQ